MGGWLHPLDITGSLCLSDSYEWSGCPCLPSIKYLWLCDAVMAPRRQQSVNAPSITDVGTIFPAEPASLNLTQPAVVVSLIKKKRAAKTLNSQSDLEVWEHSDDEIIGESPVCHWNVSALLIGQEAAAQKTWRSAAYDHYDVSLAHILKSGQPSKLSFVFTCILDPDKHPPHYHDQQKSSEETSNLQMGIQKCWGQLGLHETTKNNATQWIPYSEAAHCALIALSCVKHYCSFNSILDPEYVLEVKMLQLGTVLPHPATISHDIKSIYVSMSHSVCEYFMVYDSQLVKLFHLIMLLLFIRKVTFPFILYLMGGLLLLWPPSLVLSLYGTRRVWYIKQYWSSSGQLCAVQSIKRYLLSSNIKTDSFTWWAVLGQSCSCLFRALWDCSTRQYQKMIFIMIKPHQVNIASYHLYGQCEQLWQHGKIPACFDSIILWHELPSLLLCTYSQSNC